MNRSTALATLAVASTLALAGCAGGGEETAGDAAPETTTSVSPNAQAGDGQTASPSGSAVGAGISSERNEADVTFAQAMRVHHQQAVEMSETVLAKDGIPEEVRDLAEGVIATQRPEIDLIEQMLEAWGEPTTPESGGMEGMGDESMGSDSGAEMDGMMSEEDTAALDDAQGVEAARIYLEQMTIHHESAIEMARDQVENGANPEAIALAEDIEAAQVAEIAEMRQMLEELPAAS